MALTTYITYTQHDKKNQYIAGPCACFKCSAVTPKEPCRADSNHVRDWEIGVTDCCGGWCRVQSICVPVNDAICKTASFVTAKWDKEAPNVKCFYNLLRLRENTDELSKLVNRFGINQQMMWDVCKHPITQGNKKYNAIHLPGTKGDLCRAWWYQLQPYEKTRFIREYCIRVPDSQDCKCANRAKDPDYIEVKKVNVINDGCWYAPCVDKVNQFVEPSLSKPDCPLVHCSSFVKIMNNKGPVTVQKINSKIICGGSPELPPQPQVQAQEHQKPLTPLNQLDTYKSILSVFAAATITAAASFIL